MKLISNDFLNTVSRTVHKAGFKIKMKSPELLLVAGAIGVVAGTVMACKATLKVDEKLEEHKNALDRIEEATENGVTQAGLEYTEKDAKADKTKVYLQASMAMVKLYAPSAIVIGLSIAAFGKSHAIMAKRCASLVAVAKAWEKTHKEYRGRVIDRFGEDVDRELRCNSKLIESEKKIINEDGTEETQKVYKEEYEQPSDYSFIFDEACKGWTKDARTNLFVLRTDEQFLTRRLREKGYLFLNEVREYFGLPGIDIGQYAGWYYDEKDPNRDNCIDFGLDRVCNNPAYDERRKAFLNGDERNVLIDPNCEGYIIDKLVKSKKMRQTMR